MEQYSNFGKNVWLQKKNEPRTSQRSQALMEQKEKECNFLDQLLEPSKIGDYQLPIPINAELRRYQQVGDV